jgi:hypothetical protein
MKERKKGEAGTSDAQVRKKDRRADAEEGGKD